MKTCRTVTWPPPERRVVLTLLDDRPIAPLSPFYALARYIGVADCRGRLHRLIEGPGSSADNMTASILECAPRVLITGFVPDNACTALIAAGIDVRLGHCSEPATELVRRYQSLPKPGIARPWPDHATRLTRGL